MGKYWNFGLIGYPLGHSLSPNLHSAALSAIGLRGSYNLIPLPPIDTFGKELQIVLSKIRSGEIDGINVTIPHKQIVLRYLDDLTSEAEAVLAVNTIYLEGDRLVGTNTDVPGFIIDLSRKISSQIGSSESFGRRLALILGAGGSARAVVYGLTREGWSIVIAARRPQQAEDLVKSMNIRSNCNIVPLTITALQNLTRNEGDYLQLVVNTTPVGMMPNIESSPLPQQYVLPPACIVYDLVYNPRRTKLIAETVSKGNSAYNGLGMLVEQAALAFEIWTSQPADRAAMWESVN